MSSIRVSRVAFAVLFTSAFRFGFCDIAPLHAHVQTPGVKTCKEAGGSCRGASTCNFGETVQEYDEACDSGCGYWRGRCGQTCCMGDEEDSGPTVALVPEKPEAGAPVIERQDDDDVADNDEKDDKPTKAVEEGGTGSGEDPVAPEASVPVAAKNASNASVAAKAADGAEGKFEIFSSRSSVGAKTVHEDALYRMPSKLVDALSLAGVSLLVFALFKCSQSRATEQTIPLMGTELE